MTNNFCSRTSLAVLAPASILCALVFASARADDAKPSGPVLTGKEALGDWTTDAPGIRRKLTLDDLPPPFDTPSAQNFPRPVARPEGAWPHAPKGFKVTEFATGLNNPRKIITAPNGDIFVAESMPGRIKVLRDADGDGKPETVSVFASGLRQPFGLAFYPPSSATPTHLYVGNTGNVVRFAYKDGDTKAQGEPQMLVPNIPSGAGRLGGGGHWTRDVVFSKDGKTHARFGRVTVQCERRRRTRKRRADILVFDPDGKNEKIFAWGIRNAVGLAIHPETGQVWASVNERDVLGDHLVPDYVTHVEEGGFYGWPWYYLGRTRTHATRESTLSSRTR